MVSVWRSTVSARACAPSTVGPSGALFVITYVELLQEGNVARGEDQLLDYGAATSSLNGSRILSYSVLQQLDRQETRVRETLLWSSWWWFGFVVLLLTAEWLLRKRWRLV